MVFIQPKSYHVINLVRKSLTPASRHHDDIRDAKPCERTKFILLRIVLSHKCLMVEALLQEFLDRLFAAEIHHPVTGIKCRRFEGQLDRNRVTMQERTMRIGAPLTETAGEAQFMPI